MRRRSHFLTRSAIIAALYTILCYLQNLIFPDSASMAVQFRAAEALSVLAFFTPAAIGTLASVCAAGSMYLLRNIRFRKLPIPGLLMPGLFNALLVGWELMVYVGGGFWLNAFCVALGEWVVLLTLGSLLYTAIRSRKLDQRLFSVSAASYNIKTESRKLFTTYLSVIVIGI